MACTNTVGKKAEESIACGEVEIIESADEIASAASENRASGKNVAGANRASEGGSVEEAESDLRSGVRKLKSVLYMLRKETGRRIEEGNEMRGDL